MNWDDVEANWTAYVPRILTRWPVLDETEVLAIDGDFDRLVAYVAVRTSQSVEAAGDEVRGWAIGAEPADVTMDETRDNDRITASANHIPAGEDVYSDDDAFGDDDVPEPPVARTG